MSSNDCKPSGRMRRSVLLSSEARARLEDALLGETDAGVDRWALKTAEDICATAAPVAPRGARRATVGNAGEALAHHRPVHQDATDGHHIAPAHPPQQPAVPVGRLGVIWHGDRRAQPSRHQGIGTKAVPQAGAAAGVAQNLPFTMTMNGSHPSCSMMLRRPICNPFCMVPVQLMKPSCRPFMVPA